jgi:hypothetical protein
MAATTTAIDTKKLTGEQFDAVGVLASTKIPAGALVALTSAGYATNAADTAGHKVIGIAESTVDNSAGASAALTITTIAGPVSGFVNDATNPCTIAHLGRTVYVLDNQTIRSVVGTNSIKAGILMGINADGSLKINITPNH